MSETETRPRREQSSEDHAANGHDGPPRPVFFRPGEIVLLFEPLAAARGRTRQALTGRPVESLAAAFAHPSSPPSDALAFEALRGALQPWEVLVTGAGRSLLLDRGGDPHLMQIVYLDGRQAPAPAPQPGDDTAHRGQFTSVREAVERLQAATRPGGPLPGLVVGGYRLVGASPNWLTTPFFNGV